MAGLRDLIKKRMDAIESAADAEPPKKAPTTPPPAVKPSAPITADEAAKKAARFKWERENPGVPYKEPQPGKANGGLVKGAGTGTSDSNLVPLSKGEFVLPADTVKKLGVRNLRDLVKETHAPIPGQPQGLADGGTKKDYESRFSRSDRAYAEYEKVAKQNAYERAQRAQTNALRPDMEAIRRASGSGGSIPSGGVEIPKTGILRTPREALNASLPSKTVAGPGLGKVVGSTGKVISGAGRIAAPVAVGTEAFMAGRDVIDPNVDGLMKAARVTESLGRMGSAYVGAKGGAALGALGGPVAPITVPLGAIAGGAAGYFAPELLGAGDSMPSNIIDKQREQNGLREASGTIRQPAPAPAPAPLPPGALEQRVKDAQAGLYQDQNDRRMAQAGGVAPSPQAQVATKIADGATATDLAAPDGGGYISGVDKDGMRRMVGYTKDTMPAPMGITDTTSPEVKAADRANRERWKAEAAAIDARMAARNQADADRFERMGYENKRAVAEYQRGDVLDRMKRANVYSPAERRAMQEELKAAGYGVLEATKGLEGISDRQAAAERTAAAERMAKARDELGLRGQMYQADSQYAGDVLKSNATLQAAQVKAAYDAAKLQNEMRGDNLKAFNDWSQRTFTRPVVDKDGRVTGNMYDPAQFNEFVRSVYASAVDNPKFLAQFGVKDVKDLPQDAWERIYNSYAKSQQFTRAVNTSADAGDSMVTGVNPSVRVRPVKVSDFASFGNEPQNSISLRQSVMGAAGFGEKADQLVVEVAGASGPAQRRMMSDLITNDPRTAEYIIERMALIDPEGAKKLRAEFTPKVPGLRN